MKEKNALNLQQDTSNKNVLFTWTHSKKSKNPFFSFTGKKGKRIFFDEKGNWLGNVNVVISDKKFGVDSTGDGVADYYFFGSTMPGRTFNPTEYRFWFGNKEKDEEIKGSGNSYDFEARFYDPRIGRILSIDPLFAEQAGWSTYKAKRN